MARLAAVAALAGCAAVLAGCGSVRTEPVPDADRPAATAAPGPGDAGAALPSALPSPTDDAASDGAALEAARTAVTAFARPRLDPATWWAGLAPLLSPSAAVAFEGTDPAEVPASAVTGPPRAAADDTAYLATVLVPTDTGDLAVLLVREGAGAPWLVERITPVGPAPSAP
ncbi:hypothetical protein [Geodermatophilus marinus]|uniref:hypothetical protein n=1 Tax=Geodermatophilus sp. LHW52908 TaxID=2303986 RepID=UPI000E3E472A|nr:hypothetical protein [Geodermatophilus sp. LHW52908]RFU22989.1 hypothetical protein D0Z06_03870 [Geodermatophilus sp. LHW52908]